MSSEFSPNTAQIHPHWDSLYWQCSENALWPAGDTFSLAQGCCLQSCFVPPSRRSWSAIITRLQTTVFFAHALSYLSDILSLLFCIHHNWLYVVAIYMFLRLSLSSLPGGSVTLKHPHSAYYDKHVSGFCA